MSIKNKILLYFIVVTTILVGVALFFIYSLFRDYRERDFHLQQKEKVSTTLLFLSEIKEIDEKLLDGMDLIKISHLYDEKLMIFDENKKLIYSSIDDTRITAPNKILEELNMNNMLTSRRDGNYDVVGVMLEKNGKYYYGISKAFDVSGYHNLNYLKYVLSLTFLCITVVVIVMSYYLSKIITKPIIALARQINDFKVGDKYSPIIFPDTKNEVSILGQRFNELMQRMNEAFSFQKHAVHHISHELKTPIAVLVSNFERIEKETDLKTIRTLLIRQKEETESLSKIINSLLEIAKTESGAIMPLNPVRIDELIFDLEAEFKMLSPDFQFSIQYSETLDDEHKLTVLGNVRLLKSAISNLMINCIQYSDDNAAKILINPNQDILRLLFINNGQPLSVNEQPFIFQRYFRGANSKGKSGFGLGLVFIRKILLMHQGDVVYTSDNENSNTFTVILPLS